MTNAITDLRDIVPVRPLTITESVRIAELQANRLRTLTDTITPALPETGAALLK